MPSQMAWSEPAPSYGYGQAYPDSGFNAEIPQSAMPEIQTSMAWEGGEGSMEGQQTYGDTYGAEMSPYGEVHWAQQGVEGEAGFSPGWSEAAPQVKEKKKKKHRDKKMKKEEEHAMDDFSSVSSTPTADAWGGEIATAATAATASGGGDGNIDAQVKMLKDMGFADENRVRVVLEAVGNDVEKAVPVLLSEH
ncbi:unnamed protein product [Cladocopium goreaui]|uniref:UBA domain-containing protein n=1 Tax=Cladocopium goreaui TaxID=2562237 RepID=A0A9P1GHX5_9DINO|nr:unnamed protein product [Cladocopium goreaui]